MHNNIPNKLSCGGVGGPVVAHGLLAVYIVSCIVEAGRVALEHFGAYAVSKSGIEMYSDVLRLEMKKWDVQVSIIEPQCYKTGLYCLSRSIDSVTMSSFASNIYICVLTPPWCRYTFCGVNMIKSAMHAYYCTWNRKNNPETYAID